MDIERHVQAIQADLADRSRARRRGRRRGRASDSPRRSARRSSCGSSTFSPRRRCRSTAQLSSGHVEVRLAGRDPELVLVDDSGGESEPRRRRRATISAPASRSGCPRRSRRRSRRRREQRGRLGQRVDRAGALPCARAASRPRARERQPATGLHPELREEQTACPSTHPSSAASIFPAVRRVAPADGAVPTASASSAGPARPLRRPVMTTFETPGARRSCASRSTAARSRSRRPTTGTVDVELVPLRDNDVTRQAIAEARVEMSDRGGGHEVVVELKRKSGFARRSRCQGRRPRPLPPRERPRSCARLRRPRTRPGRSAPSTSRRPPATSRSRRVARLSVDTASGDVRARDVAGTADLRTASGDVMRAPGGRLPVGQPRLRRPRGRRRGRRARGDDGLRRRPRSRGGRWRHPGAVRLGRRAARDQAGRSVSTSTRARSAAR